MVRSHLVLVSTLHNVAPSVFFAFALRKGGGSCHLCYDKEGENEKDAGNNWDSKLNA